MLEPLIGLFAGLIVAVPTPPPLPPPIPEVVPIVVSDPAPIPPPLPLATSTIIALTGKYADKYKLTGWRREYFFKTIQQESGFDPNVQSGKIQRDGSQEESYGLAQIHLPDHPEITKEQALDPDFALDFMAKRFAVSSPQQLGILWHAFRDLYFKQ